jgi:hypothetical protein
MDKRRIGLVGVLVLLLAAAGHAFEADFDPSTYNPGVAEMVNFEVCEPCLDGEGCHYRWDFDADGLADAESDEALVTYAFEAPGYYEVVLTVSDVGGRTSSRRKGLQVGELPAFAVRELLIQPDGTILVLLHVAVTSGCSAIGLEEGMTQGWQLEVVDAGGAIALPNPETRKLEVVWAREFTAGEMLTFSYRLYPAYAVTLQAISGRVSGYVDGERFVGGVSGELGVPQ